MAVISPGFEFTDHFKGCLPLAKHRDGARVCFSKATTLD